MNNLQYCHGFDLNHPQLVGLMALNLPHGQSFLGLKLAIQEFLGVVNICEHCDFIYIR
jgi:hypothetical protein